MLREAQPRTNSLSHSLLWSPARSPPWQEGFGFWQGLASPVSKGLTHFKRGSPRKVSHPWHEVVSFHSKETRVLHLRNPTRLPIAWRLGGIDNIGDEFSFSQEQGIIQSKSEFPLRVHFRSPKPVVHSKKTIKIEVGLTHISSQMPFMLVCFTMWHVKSCSFIVV